MSYLFLLLYSPLSHAINAVAFELLTHLFIIPVFWTLPTVAGVSYMFYFTNGLGLILQPPVVVSPGTARLKLVS